MAVITLHGDCVACLAKNNDLSGEEQSIVLIAMQQHGHTLESIERDLCFAHRRKVTEVRSTLA